VWLFRGRGRGMFRRFLVKDFDMKISFIMLEMITAITITVPGAAQSLLRHNRLSPIRRLFLKKESAAFSLKRGT
jgi:hypothetical protein